MKLKRAKEGKIPPIPGFELQVTQCLVGATLASPPGGRIFSLKPKVLNSALATVTSTEGLQQHVLQP